MTTKTYVVQTPQGKMTRKEIYPVEMILKQVQFKDKREAQQSKVDFDGDLINMASDRYKLFYNQGCKCCVCGLEGFYFAKERHYYQEGSSFHLNLYGLDEKGIEVLLTKDHIIPKSKGGKNYYVNYQTMCQRCNESKADEMPNVCYSPEGVGRINDSGE